MPPVVRMVDDFGKARDVHPDDVAGRKRAGWTIESDAAAAARVASEAEAEAYSGVGATIDAYGAGVARAVAPGVSDVAIGAIGGDQATRRLRKLKEHQGLASGAGEVAGGITAAATGFGPIGEAATLGARVAKAGEGAGALTRIARAGAGAGIEGGAQGFGQGLSELALSEDPLTIERALSTLSSRTLYGAGVGAAAGSVAKTAEIGLLKGKAALDDFAARQSKRAELGDDLANADAKGLRAAETAERDRLAAEQVQQRAATVDEITAYRDSVKAANPWAAISEGEAASQLNKSARAMRNLMDDPVGLARNPGQALKALRVQEQAFTRAMGEADAIGAKLAGANQKIAKELSEELATLPDNLGQVALSGKMARRYGTFADVKVPKAGTLSVSREDAVRFLDALEGGQVTGTGQGALGKLPDLIAANRALQARIESSMVTKADLTSKKLADILAARDALSTGGGKSLAEQMAGATVYSGVSGVVSAIPFVGPFMAPFIGAKASSIVGDKVFGRLGKAMAEKTARAAKAVGAVFETTARGAKYVPPVATRVLSQVAFAPEREERKPGGRKLSSLYKQRTAELREQVQMGPLGKAVVKPVVRARIAAALQPIGVMQPMFADRMETLAVRRLEFLFDKMPKRPDVGGIPIGPDRWEPSEMQMRSWARFVAAVEDPDGVLERVAAGMVTPEDAETMRTLYSEQLQQFTQQVLERLPELRQTLPYNRRIALSVLTGVPVDASMEPRIIARLQAQYATESAPPKPTPQFGSVKNTEVGTPSERREQRT